MCLAGERIAKLCRVAGEVNYELHTEVGDELYYNHRDGVELRRAQAILTAQGDPWALEVFDRTVEKLKDRAKDQSILARLHEARTPSATVEEALTRADQVLCCEETQPMIERARSCRSG